MVAGELAHRSEDAVDVAQQDLGPGAAVMPNGRVSIARRVLPDLTDQPFTPPELSSLDEALTLASRAAGLGYSVYLGDLGADSRARAEELHASIGQAASSSVLIAVSPSQRLVEIVTGEEAARRLPDRSCKLAVMSMVASFKEGDLAGGLVSGLRMLADQAGAPPKH